MSNLVSLVPSLSVCFLSLFQSLCSLLRRSSAPTPTEVNHVLESSARVQCACVLLIPSTAVAKFLSIVYLFTASTPRVPPPTIDRVVGSGFRDRVVRGSCPLVSHIFSPGFVSG